MYPFVIKVSSEFRGHIGNYTFYSNDVPFREAEFILGQFYESKLIKDSLSQLENDLRNKKAINMATAIAELIDADYNNICSSEWDSHRQNVTGFFTSEELAESEGAGEFLKGIAKIYCPYLDDISYQSLINEIREYGYEALEKAVISVVDIVEPNLLIHIHIVNGFHRLTKVLQNHP